MSNKRKREKNNKYQYLNMNMIVRKGIVVEISTCKGDKGIRIWKKGWC